MSTTASDPNTTVTTTTRTYTYQSPLAIYAGSIAPLVPLDSEARNPDGKSLVNPPAEKLSGAYESFPEPIISKNNGFDFHIYYVPANPGEARFARELHERIRREFPELRVYKFFDKPVGPHPIPMFEVNVFTPLQMGAFFSWLVVNRGPCSVLVHPNTGEAYKDHTELATWMGKPWPLSVHMLGPH